ncbi:alpha/beta fold hydrolase [Altericroceibacterium xinjiangense]|uniref:alpha/beta fold hydrolase n=1 Tax=Altericroceibacterium xinjiangense TaxID=762261 RepID=UPI000F7DBD66|nr:alpha/beta hydrolase [Altericroceibacterium xinjiangense]
MASENQGSAKGGWIAAGAAAAALAGSALFNRASARRAEADTPPAGTFVEVDGVRLHYTEQGTGPAVVLLHGNGVLLQDFAISGVTGLAAAHNRVIAFDRPGFGYSDRPDETKWTPEAQARLIARALERIGVERAVIVGHSWGTMVALAMALNHPDRTTGLVLISGYYFGTARPDVLAGSAPAIPLIGPLLAHTLAPLAGRALGPAGFKAPFAPAPVPDRFGAFPLAMSLRPGQVQASASDTALMIPSAIRLSRRYDELRLPIVVMAGDGDLITHADEHAQPFASQVPCARLDLIHGQGHMLHYAVPEQVAAAIDAVQVL